MRRVLLASSLLLIPTLAVADPQCSIQPAALPAATSPAASQAARLQPVSVEAASPAATSQALRVIGTEEIGRVAALQRIASAGAQLTDLGTEHGLRTVFARNGQTFQVFYITPDGQGAIGGVMWDSTGRNITRQQVSSIDGAIPTVTIGAAAAAPRMAVDQSAPSALQTVASTTYGVTGPSTAPRLWMFIDPLCSFSVRAMEQLQPFVIAGKVQVAVIPLSLLDYEDHGGSTDAALVMLTRDPGSMVKAWTDRDLTNGHDVGSVAKLQANMVAQESLGLHGTPTFYWRKADGTEGHQVGLPPDFAAMIASIAPAAS
jgi:thiol:disulfide interchange protein DsbG